MQIIKLALVVEINIRSIIYIYL